MKQKNLWGLLAVLFVAVFALAACSNDDDDDKTGTYEYYISYSDFKGSVDNMNTVSTAFKQAFGTDAAPFKLTGTKSECNRKAKEYAMKAQAALANDGSFSATIELINAATNETIHSFTIKMDENFSAGNMQKSFKYELNAKGITLYGLKGKHVKIEQKSMDIQRTVFDDVISTDTQSITLTFRGSYYGKYSLTLLDETSNKELCTFDFYFYGKRSEGEVYYYQE